MICDRLQENLAQRGTLRIFFLHLQSCRHPDIKLSKFYRRSLSRYHCNRPNRSLPSTWNNTFLRNRLIFSRYLRTPRCARFSCRWSHISPCCCTARLITHVIIATGWTCQFSWFFKLPSFCIATQPMLEQLLKEKVGLLTTVVKISSVE